MNDPIIWYTVKSSDLLMMNFGHTHKCKLVYMMWFWCLFTCISRARPSSQKQNIRHRHRFSFKSIQWSNSRWHFKLINNWSLTIYHHQPFNHSDWSIKFIINQVIVSKDSRSSTWYCERGSRVICIEWIDEAKEDQLVGHWHLTLLYSIVIIRIYWSPFKITQFD